MKIVLTNKVYFRPDEQLLEELKKYLTYEIVDQKVQVPRYHMMIGKVASDTYWMPSTRLDLLTARGYELDIVDKRVCYPMHVPKPTFTLRDDQADIIDDYVDEERTGALLNGKPGFGKTIAALALAYELQQKTLVICTNVDIRRMWEKEIEKFFGFSPSVIGSGRYEHDKCITVANIQTVRKYGSELASEFGLLVVDECLDYTSMVTTRDGLVTIGKIVNQKLTPEVRSFNKETKSWEWKRVTHHFKSKAEEPCLILRSGQELLKCTGNHKIYQYDPDTEEVSMELAKNLDVGSLVVKEKTHKSLNLPTREGYKLLFDLSLGDGCIQKTQRGMRLSMTQGEAQLPYLEHKIELLGDLVTQSPREGASGYSDNKVYAVGTVSVPDIYNFRDSMYRGSTNTHVSKHLIDMFWDWNTWAYLFMDDGSMSRRMARFSLCSWDKETLEYLGDKYFAETGYHIITCGRGHNYLSLHVASTELLVSKIGHLVHPSLRYKLEGHQSKAKAFSVPEQPPLLQPFSVMEVEEIDSGTFTRGFKFDLEVADNHNYLANGKLVSNCHHCVAATFDYMVMNSKAKYKLGLTGTLWRKDGLHVCFPNYFGTHIYQPKERNTIKPDVHRHKFPMEIPGVSATPWALRINELYEQEEYRSKLKRLANAYALLGHKVLLVTDRTELLEWLAEDNQVPSFLITGKVDDRLAVQEEVTACPTGCILAATQSIFSEGISLNALSCVILGAPTNNDSLVEQIAGRIQRIEDGKLSPILVDCVLAGNTGSRHARTRYLVYQRRGWPVENWNEPYLAREIQAMQQES